MTQSMFELKVPVPIRTFGAIVTIEGELPTFAGSGLVSPSWTDSTGDSFWGGDNEVLAPEWSAGATYPGGYVAKYAGYVYQAPSPSGISAGTQPSPGTQAGGYYGAESVGGSVALIGAKQQFRVGSTVTVQGATIYGLTVGYDDIGGGGINPGTRVGIADGTSSLLDSNNNYNSYPLLAEGTYTGPNHAGGEVHITFDKPALLTAGVAYAILVGDTQPIQNAVFQPSYPAGSLSAPVSEIGANESATGGRNGGYNGSNASSRLYFKLWTTPWLYLPNAVPAEPRDARFMVYVGPSGMEFDAISEDMLTEVSLPDPTYVGSRQCFRLKDIIPATPAALQSLYIRYAPTNLPTGGPHGVALYNVTAAPYVPGYELGPHSTSALFS